MLINNSLRLAVVALLLMLGAVACSGGNADNTETNDTARPTEQTLSLIHISEPTRLLSI